MQELRLVAVSEDGTYLVLATAGRGTRFTLPVDDRLRAAVRGNFSRLGQYEIEVESPLRPKEIQARIRAGETAEEIAATAGIPVERVRWFEGPVLQEREYMAQQAQRVAVRLPGESTAGPTLGELVAERLTRRGVSADEIDWDSCKRDDGLWRIKLGFVWNGHTRHAEWLFDPRRRHVSPHDEEAMRLSAADYVEPEDDTTVRPFVPRVAKLTPVPSLAPEPLMQPPVHFPSVVRQESSGQQDSRHDAPALSRPEPPALSRPEPPSLPSSPSPAAFHRDLDPEPIPGRHAATADGAHERPADGQASEEELTPRVEEPAPTETAPAADDAAPPRTAEPDAEQAPAGEPAAAASAAPKRAAAKPDSGLAASKRPPDKPAADKPAAQETPPAAPSQPAPKPAPARPARRRGRRTSVPSWDEIMFGARRQD
ncbi:septation protein SepH [Thermostaphylospora chromogena]|uniref:DUF3071 domain-containing protein n=1 Tax=Thermostaphylospora chromogena TaxID=35622 RepID=A0A1H1HYN2_9ACTN|nr:septation protein SepH [Thermostaphylospora chromogena]SDR30554.1 Protein of unknown function [Thermostaphylospora chromogena]